MAEDETDQSEGSQSRPRQRAAAPRATARDAPRETAAPKGEGGESSATKQAERRPSKARSRSTKALEGRQRAQPTEKPVATSRTLSQFVISVDDGTGAIIKIERLDDETNERTELSREEYVAAYSHAYFAAPYYASYAASLYDPLSSPDAQAYLKFISDYAKAAAASAGVPGVDAVGTYLRSLGLR